MDGEHGALSGAVVSVSMPGLCVYQVDSLGSLAHVQGLDGMSIDHVRRSKKPSHRHIEGKVEQFNRQFARDWHVTHIYHRWF